MGCPPSEEEHSKEVVKSSNTSVLCIIVFLQTNCPVSFLHLTYPGILPWVVYAPLSQDGSQSEGFWEEQDQLWPGFIS